jgi:hypothetical protein
VDCGNADVLLPQDTAARGRAASESAEAKIAVKERMELMILKE